MTPILQCIHLLCLCLWVGGMAFMTFVTAPSIFKVLPRERAGDVVGEIFPRYFLLEYTCCLLVILTALGIYYREGYWNRPKLYVLGLALILSFYNGLVIAPRVHALRMEMKRVEKEEEKGVVWGQFVRYHGQSAVINLMVLAAGLALILLTAYHMRV
jgi:uncharacterized membrane protein